VSRPTNPTGNVLTDHEIQGLSELALQRDIPLILDSAYGVPFPSMIFSHAQPFWNENVILSMSLSKFGLPATRTGIVIASKDMVKTLGRINSIQSLATPSLGAELGLKLIQKGQLFSLSEHLIRPFYHNKVKAATQQLEAGLKGLPCRIHEPEGALFLWLWCQDLPISSKELYERLKSKNVLVIPGENFFPGLEDPNWEHQQQCIRISYAQDDATVKAGLEIIIETLKALYP
jgi:valine--pyruvate aminotransferase